MAWLYAVPILFAVVWLFSIAYHWGWTSRQKDLDHWHELATKQALEIIRLKTALFKLQGRAGIRRLNEPEN
jgi:hypothetical protein